MKKLRHLIVMGVIFVGTSLPAWAGGITMKDNATAFVNGSEASWPNEGYVDGCLNEWLSIVNARLGKHLVLGDWVEGKKHAKVVFTNTCASGPNIGGLNYPNHTACIAVNHVLNWGGAGMFDEFLCAAAAHEVYEMTFNPWACDNQPFVQVGAYTFPDCKVSAKVAKKTGCKDVFKLDCEVVQ